MRLDLNNKLFYGFLAFLLLTFNLSGQSVKRQSISSYGSSANAENIFIGSTAGQSFSTSFSSPEGGILQGFQQPAIFTLKPVITAAPNSLDVLVYPNPASQFITISSEKVIEQSFIRVTDLNGRTFFSEKVPKLLSHSVNCATWANGIYFITIQDADQNTKTYRLIISK